MGGSDYTCTFDAQFCSALDTNGCISEHRQGNRYRGGDESRDTVTVSANTIPVKECLATDYYAVNLIRSLGVAR